MALAAGLVALAPFFALFAFVGHPQAFLYLKGRWRYAGIAVTAVVSAIGHLGGAADIVAGAWWEGISVAVICIVLAGVFFHVAELADDRNRKQRRALTELHEANTKLEAALEETAACTPNCWCGRAGRGAR
ncbi:hypothetical protein ACN27G_10260 [Plantactinospora sp. WMMB334]|uniref:hypothetical protein n=1 Tax=Plantactinospora sp. WMMB334 TaxID=3404119 RepID=UPI003B947145